MVSVAGFIMLAAYSQGWRAVYLGDYDPFLRMSINDGTAKVSK